MADAVSTNVIFGSAGVPTGRVVVHLTCVSDGTGETSVVKVDRSAMLNPAGQVPTKLNVMSIRWAVQGFTSVRLYWDHTADDTIAVLSANGYDNYEMHGGLRDPNTSGDAVTGAIGDIILTSAGAVAGATYDITLECEPR